MPFLRAEEHRYQLATAPGERARARRIPGGRWSTAQQALTFARQPAVVLALDRVFPDGWLASEDVAAEVAEARGRERQPPVHGAVVNLDGGRFAVECRWEDRELVKLVPGYRWAPGPRQWFVEAVPLAFEILAEAFAGKLSAGPGVEEFLAQKRAEEEAHEAADRLPDPGQTAPAERAATELLRTAGPGTVPAEAPAGLGEVLARIVAALERIETKLDALPATNTGAVAEPAPLPTTRDEAAAHAHGPEWRELLAAAADAPAETLEEAHIRLQTAGPGENCELRAVAGIAAALAGQFEAALRHVRTALDGSEPLPGDLATRAADAYERAAVGSLAAVCGPELPMTTAPEFRGALVAELVHDGGFDDAAIGSAEARTRLEFLVKDPVLRRVSPRLADYCRIAHLLGSVRSGMWMAHARVADVLREDSLGDEAFALGLVLYANVLMGTAGASDWVARWPEFEENVLAAEGARTVARALERLPRVERDLAAPAALALLACIAPGDVEQATLDERRHLVELTRQGPRNDYAEFLAVFRPAAAGLPVSPRHFPGYLAKLQTFRLEQSAHHIEEVVYNGHEPSGMGRAIADEAFLPALQRGVHDPAAEVMPLLDLLDMGTKPDNLLNALAEAIEDEAFPGAAAFTREQRLDVYRRALDRSVRERHDDDSLRAFYRLVRALDAEPGTEAILALSGEYLNGFKPLRVPAFIAQAEAMLDTGAPAGAVLELAEPYFLRQDQDTVHVVGELAGLAEVYPAHREAITAFLQAKGTPGAREEAPRFEGKRVVVVGGHPRLQTHLAPALARAGVETEWLTPEEAKQGDRLGALVRGTCDLVVLNTSCISHAASGRAEDAARGKEVVKVHMNGIGSVLAVIQACLAEMSQEKPAEAPDRRRAANDKRKRLLRH